MRMLQRALFVLGTSILSIQLALAETCVETQSTLPRYSVYLIPRLPATLLYKNWAPFLKRLGKESDVCFELHIPKNFKDFEYAIRTGKPDFVWLNPYHQVMVVRKPGYVPLVHDKHSGLAGVLVVRKDSMIQDIQQLNGKTVAFPAPNAYVASLLIRSLLAHKNIYIKADYVGSHNNVYRAVALGATEAGGGANTTLDHEPLALRSQLRVLFTTKFYVPHPFSAHPRIPKNVQEKVISNFVNMTADPAGRALLKAISYNLPTRADYVRDYQELEQLDLDRFVISGDR